MKPPYLDENEKIQTDSNRSILTNHTRIPQCVLFFYQHGHRVFFFSVFFFFFLRGEEGRVLVFVYGQLGHFDISQLTFYPRPLRTSIEPKSTRPSVFPHAFFRTFSCKKRISSRTVTEAEIC